MTQRALLVMAKQPAPGRTKTRLCPPLTNEAAADLYSCFLQDVLTTVRALAAQTDSLTPMIAYTPASAQDFFQQLAPDFHLLPQRGERLGDRLQNVLSAALEGQHFACSAQRPAQAIAISSDSPTLPAGLLYAAFQSLDEPQVDAVFGPCEDGGYYLVGVKEPPGRLTTGVQMSTPSVLRDTLAIAAEEGVRVKLLAAWYDVDSADDLDRLRLELATYPARAPHSSHFLNQTVAYP